MLFEQIRSAVAQAVQEAIAHGAHSGYIGPYSERLSQQLSELHGNAEILLTCSGTAALEILLRAMDVGPGDTVCLSAYDYPGNFWAVERVGARPALLDVAADSWNLNLDQLPSLADAQGPVSAGPGCCRALIASHLHGALQPIPRLRAWCEQHGVWLIEDACQAIGSTLDGQPVGTLGHASIVSFGGSKVLSTGRGGGLLSNDSQLMQRARIKAGAGSGPYALSEIQAAIVCEQLGWLPAIARATREFFADIDQRLQTGLADYHCGVQFPARPHLDQLCLYQAGWLIEAIDDVQSNTEHQRLRDRIVEAVKQRSIPIGLGFDGFYRRSSRRCDRLTDLLNAKRAAESTWTLPFSMALTTQPSSDEVAESIINAASADC